MREKREREGYNTFIRFKILKFHVCVYPNVDGPSKYDNKIVRGIPKRVLLLVYHFRKATILMLI